jgi:hypothetical protein
LFCPPTISRAVHSTRTRSRTNTKISPFQTTDTVLPMLPALAGATAAKVLVCFSIMLFVKFPPWGARKSRASLLSSFALEKLVITCAS